MGLAHIRPDPAGGGQGSRAFVAELGTNRYWRVAVGSDDVRGSDGARLMAEPVHVTPVAGPVPPEARGRVRITLPEDLFDRDNRHVQLMTYREANGAGPAVSRILRSAPGLPDALPALGFSQAMRGGAHTAPYAVPVRWTQPEALPVSHAMVLPAFLAPLLSAAGPLLAGALPKLATSVAPFAGELLQSVLAGRDAPQNADQSGDERQALDAAIAALRALAGAGGGAGGNGTAAPTPTPAASEAQSVRRIRRRLARRSAAKSALVLQGRKRGGLSAMQARSPSLRDRLPADRSQAMVAPLAALLPMLTPLLGKVLTPETVQSIVAMPNEHMKTIFNAMKDAGKLAIESAEQDLRHLRALTPSVDDPALDALLSSANVGFSLSRGEDWQRAESVSLRMEPCRQVSLAGRPTCLLSGDADWSFPMSVELPRDAKGRQPAMKDAVLRLVVKDKESLAELHRQEWPAGTIAASGPLLATPRVDAARARQLPRGKDLICAFVLLWKNARGESRGAPLQHVVQVAGGAMFDRLQPTGQVQRLDEASGFGDYVHDVWQNRFRADAKRVEGELTYLCPFSAAASSHRRMETQYQSAGVERTRQRREVRLRSGFEISLAMLGELGRMMGAQPLSPDMHRALGGAGFAEAANRSARIAFDFRGAPDEVFRLRVVPVYELARCTFRVPGQPDARGQIASMEEVEAQVPIPARLELEVHNDSTQQQIGEPVSAPFLAARMVPKEGGSQ